MSLLLRGCRQRVCDRCLRCQLPQPTAPPPPAALRTTSRRQLHRSRNAPRLQPDASPHEHRHSVSDHDFAPSSSSPPPSSRSFPPSPLCPPSEVLILMLQHNAHARWQQTRDLFHRHRMASTLPLTEDVCDAALHAMVELEAAETMRSFASMLSAGVATSCRLYNRMLQLLCRRLDSSSGGEHVTDSAQQLLQLMQSRGLQPDLQSRFLLTSLHLQHMQTTTAYTQYAALSRLLDPPAATLSAADFTALFRLFYARSHVSGCEMVVEDMQRSGLTPKTWMRQQIHRLQRALRRKEHSKQQRQQKRNTPLELWEQEEEEGEQPVQAEAAAVGSASTFRVGLQHRAAPSLHPDVIRSIDEVDPLPPSAAELLGPYAAELRSLLHSKVEEDGDGLQQLMVGVLRDCYEEGDAGRVRAFCSSPGAVTLTPLLLNLALCTLATADPPASSSSPLSFADRAGLLHDQMSFALTVWQQLEREGGELQLTPAMLLLRAMAYLPQPHTASSSSSVSLASSLVSLLSFSSSTFPTLPAEFIAKRAAALYAHCARLIVAYSLPSSSSSSATLSLLFSLHVRAQCKHPLSGNQLLLTLPAFSASGSALDPASSPDAAASSPTSSIPPLLPSCYSCLIYQQVLLPVKSMQTPYRLFSLLQASYPASSPPALCLYYLLCGELLRGRHSTARAIYREAALRYQLLPPVWMTDALVLGHRVVREQMNREEERRQREEQEQKLADSLSAVCRWLKVRVGAEGLSMGREAMECWWEQRRRRRLAEKRDDGCRQRRLQQDAVIAEMLWTAMRPDCLHSASAPSLSLLTHLALFLSSSPLLPSLLASAHSLLCSPPYAHAYASDSAMTAAIETEQALYLLSCRLASIPPSVSRSGGDGSGQQHQQPVDSFTRFSFLLSTLPPHSHADFLRGHLLSRLVRCVVYSFTYCPPAVSTLDALQSAVSTQLLDLDSYCCHVLMLLSTLLSHPSAVFWHEHGLQVQRQQLHLRHSAAMHEDSAITRAGFGPGSDSQLAYTAQHLQLCRLLYEANRPEEQRDRLLLQSLLRSLLPSSKPAPFLEDAVVLALVDYAVWSRSPALLQSALSALVMDSVPLAACGWHPTSSSHERSPLPRAYSAITRGIIHAARGMKSRGWTEAANSLSAMWLSAFRFCFQHYGKEARLKLSSPSFSSSSAADSAFLRTQRELLYLVSVLSVEAGDLSPLWSMYAAVTDLTRHATSPLRLLLQLPTFVTVLKAAISSGHASDLMTARVVSDMERWLESQEGEAVEHRQHEQQETERLQETLRLCRYPLQSRRQELTISGITSRYARRVRLTSAALEAQTRATQWLSMAESEEEVKEEEETQPPQAAPAASSPLRAALWSYQQLVASPLSVTPEGQSFVFSLLDELHRAHVQPLRAAQTAREKCGDKDASRQAESTEISSVMAAAGGLQLLENLTDAYVLKLVTAVRKRAQSRRGDQSTQEVLDVQARGAKDPAAAVMGRRQRLARQ